MAFIEACDIMANLVTLGYVFGKAPRVGSASEVRRALKFEGAVTAGSSEGVSVVPTQ